MHDNTNIHNLLNMIGSFIIFLLLLMEQLVIAIIYFYHPFLRLIFIFIEDLLWLYLCYLLLSYLLVYFPFIREVLSFLMILLSLSLLSLFILRLLPLKIRNRFLLYYLVSQLIHFFIKFLKEFLWDFELKSYSLEILNKI